MAALETGLVSLSPSPRLLLVIFSFLVERVSLYDIEPRPLSVTVEIQPRPVKPIPSPAEQIAARAIVAQEVAPIAKDDPDLEPEDGPSRADVLLAAIVIVPRREPQMVAVPDRFGISPVLLKNPRY